MPGTWSLIIYLFIYLFIYFFGGGGTSGKVGAVARQAGHTNPPWLPPNQTCAPPPPPHPTRGRRVHEVEVDEVVDAQALQHQHHVAQVGALEGGCICVWWGVLGCSFGERWGAAAAAAAAAHSWYAQSPSPAPPPPPVPLHLNLWHRVVLQLMLVGPGCRGGGGAAWQQRRATCAARAAGRQEQAAACTQVPRPVGGARRRHSTGAAAAAVTVTGTRTRVQPEALARRGAARPPRTLKRRGLADGRDLRGWRGVVSEAKTPSNVPASSSSPCPCLPMSIPLPFPFRSLCPSLHFPCDLSPAFTSPSVPMANRFGLPHLQALHAAARVVAVLLAEAGVNNVLQRMCGGKGAKMGLRCPCAPSQTCIRTCTHNLHHHQPPTLMPSMVRLVSAMLVAMTTLRAPGGVGSKILACGREGREG